MSSLWGWGTVLRLTSLQEVEGVKPSLRLFLCWRRHRSFRGVLQNAWPHSSFLSRVLARPWLAMLLRRVRLVHVRPCTMPETPCRRCPRVSMSDGAIMSGGRTIPGGFFPWPGFFACFRSDGGLVVLWW